MMMLYPEKLKIGDVIGVCAPSSGIKENHNKRFDSAIEQIRGLGYEVIETAFARKDDGKCTSTTPEIRAKEFLELYENPKVKAILPPWGGEFLMEILPYIDWEKIKKLPPKWIIGYSDLTTLSFAFTLNTDIATVHGSNLMNMGFVPMHDSDRFLFEFISKNETVQYSSEKSGGYKKTFDHYALNEKTMWKSLDNNDHIFLGRMIGGCLDVICKLIGTKYAPVNDFLEKYKNDGFIWTLESCEMSSAEIYRTLWQMKENGWFLYAKGIVVGRPDNYSDNEGFTIIDALSRVFGDLNIPVIYDADIGHKPPQMQIMNGAFGKVEYKSEKATVWQKWI